MTNTADKVPVPSAASSRDLQAKEQALAALRHIGEPALLAYESRDEYLALRDAFFAELQPQGPLEAQFIEDVLYTTWDIRRFRQARTELIRVCVTLIAQPYLEKRLRDDPAFEDLDEPKRAAKAATKIKSALTGHWQDFKEVERLLATVHVTWAQLYASAIESKLPLLERIDRLLDRAERSRQATLKDFGFLQAAKALALEKRSDKAIEDLPLDAIEANSK